MMYFIMAEIFSVNDLFEPGLSLFQIRERIEEIASFEVNEAQKIFLTLWEIYYLIIEMPEGDEKEKLLKTGKSLAQSLERYLWLLNEEGIEEVISILEITKKKVMSDKGFARSLMTETVLIVSDAVKVHEHIVQSKLVK